MSSLRIKLFIALLSISAVLTGGLYVLFNFSFERGFWRYIEQKEIARAAPLIEKLEQHYATEGDWDVFAQDPQVWPEYLTRFFLESFDQRGLPKSPDLSNDNRQKDRRKERDERRIRVLLRSIVLLDSKQQIVAGDPRMRREIYRHKLEVDSQTVGFLGMPMNPALRDLHDAEFAGDQATNLALIAAAAFIFALLSALPLSYFLTKRIHLLVRYVQKLGQGDYGNQIHLKGADELTLLAEHLNNLSHSLQQSEQARRRWVADISHELRTPLAVLQADIEAMEDGVRRLDQNSLERLKKHSLRLTNLVNDLYDLSLSDIGALTYRKQPCDLRGLLQEVIATVKPQFEQQQIALDAQLGTLQSSQVFGDPQRLQQLFLNLLRNTLSYTHAPGRALVRLHGDNKNLVITFEDSAPGVDAALHEKLFERLYRAESSRNRNSGGAGLGLTLCRNIVLAHEGNIQIQDSELGGLRVIITLPVSRA